MLVAAANAASFFVRSRGFGSIFGSAPNSSPEALGFPLEIWRAGQTYDGWILNYAALPWNILTGVLLGGLFGLVGVLGKSKFNDWVAEFEAREKENRQIKLQFSVKGMLVVTTLFAIVVAATTSWGSSHHLLGAIYFLGPLGLILTAMQPDKIPWQVRIVIVIAASIGIIALALATGLKLGMTVDQVMFGIFVSWTPQSAFMAFLLTVGLIVQLLRRPKALEASNSFNLAAATKE